MSKSERGVVTPTLNLDRFILSVKERGNVREAHGATAGFLRNPVLFPHPQINGLMILQSSLIGSKRVGLETVSGLNMPLVFSVAQVNGEMISQEGTLGVSDRYKSFVEENPIRVLGSAIGIASMCRDFYTNRINWGSNGNDQLNDDGIRRSNAFEAEGLKIMYERCPGILIRYFNDPHIIKIMDAYPGGLEDLPRILRYDTPSLSSSLH